MMDPHVIAHNFSPEMAVIVNMLRLKFGCEKDDSLRLFLEKYPVDQAKLLLYLKAHYVESVIYDTDIIAGFLDNQYISQLKEEVVRRAKLNLLIFEELLSLNLLTRDNGFNVVFYKGVLLGKLLYNDLTTRSTGDIDMLINSADLFSIRDLLIQHGYEVLFNCPDKYRTYYLTINREAKFRKNISGGLYVYLELQWAPLPAMYGLPFNNDYFFANTENIHLAGESIPVLKKEQHLLMLFIHHGVGDLWRNLKHISDIAYFIKIYGHLLDWNAVMSQLRLWHIKKSAEVGLQLTEEVFGLKLPNEIQIGKDRSAMNKTLESLFSYPLLTKKKKSFVNARRQLLLADDLRGKISLVKGYAKTILYPSMIDLQNISLPRFLFPVYFITKPLRFLFLKRKT